MIAMVLDRPHAPLEARTLPAPELAPRDVLIEVEACGICRTDLHIQDGELREAKRPVVPGHQIVGRVVEPGRDARRFAAGTRVGVPTAKGRLGVWIRENEGDRFVADPRGPGSEQQRLQ